MNRALLRRLRVTGINKPNAEVEFGPRLTFITGVSNTGKTHIFHCINFALGGSTPKHEFAEARGYDRVLLEIATGDEVRTVRRTFDEDKLAEWFDGPLSEWDDAHVESLKVHPDPAKPQATLAGRLLVSFGFDASSAIPRNKSGATQTLSFRTFAPLCLVSENEAIAPASPVAKPGVTATAERWSFNLLVSGRAPTPEQLQALQQAHAEREQAQQQAAVLEPIIETLRDEIEDAQTPRSDIEAGIAAVDEQLAQISELVAASGDQARQLLELRNQALASAERARDRNQRAHELLSRFELLAEHYASDVRRLEFAMESGHFFSQLEASYCPRCGRALAEDDECHEETADFEAIEAAARAEIAKLEPRIEGLQATMEEVRGEARSTEGESRYFRDQADGYDRKIREVANPSAKSARARVVAAAERRRDLETKLLRFRELDRYLAIVQEAELVKARAVDTIKPAYDALSLRSLQQHVLETLQDWSFPVLSDVIYDVTSDDIVIDGKERAANGKGVLAVTHAAFTVGLMRHCFDQATPHPGFAVIDSPLNPYRGAATDDAEDLALRDDVHAATLRSLSRTAEQGQTVIIENIDPPSGLDPSTVCHVFVGAGQPGRAGFYPSIASRTS